MPLVATIALAWPPIFLPWMTWATGLRHSDQMGELVSRDERVGGTWCDEYREIVGFYYWEPQHLGRIKNPVTRYKNFESVWDHISGMEVALNHLLNMYFSLVPMELVNAETNWIQQDSYRFVGCVELEGISDFTQPDLLFRGGRADCAIELKVAKEKVTLAQIQKYVLLQAVAAPSTPLQILVITTQSPFEESFADRFESAEQLRQALAILPIPAHLKSRVGEDAYAFQVEVLSVRALSYEDLATGIRARMENEDPNCVIARNAHQGILRWLSDRHLTV